MANKKITDLTALGATPAVGDFLAVVDVSDTTEAATGTTKKVAFSDIATGAALADDSVTNAKLANMATQTIKGRTTAGTGDPEDLTATQATAILNNVVGDSGAGGTKGLVPAPAAGDAAAGKFLKADGTFAVPASSGAETGANSDITSMDGLTGALENPTQVIFPEAAAPATPGAGKVTLYAKSDGLLYSKDDAGTETVVTGGGGGGAVNPTSTVMPYNNAGTFADSPLIRKDANTVEQRNSTNAQRFDIFRTWTDASNNEGASLRFDSSNAYLSTQGAGTGAGNGKHWNVVSDGNVILKSNNTAGLKTLTWNTSGELLSSGNALGSSGSRWGNIWVNSFSPQYDSPAQLTANQNNYNPGTMNYIQRLTSDASRTITGFNPGGGTLQAGQSFVLVNVGSNDIVIAHENASSTAANRFLCSTGADITLTANQAADVFRDVVTQRYRVFKRN